MQNRPSTKLLLFLLALKRSLAQRRISLDQFLTEFKFLHPRGIARFEFARIVQRINAEGSNFDALLLFSEMTHNGDTLSRDNFKKWFLRMPSITVHKLPSTEVTQKPKAIEAAPTRADKRREFIKTAMPILTKYISSKDGKPSKIFDDCDINGSGEIDRLEFNKFLFASGLPEFKSRNHCRFMIDHIFDNYAGERMSKEEFFTIFKLKPTPASKKTERKPITQENKRASTNTKTTTIIVNFQKQYPKIQQKVFAANKPKTTTETKTVKEVNLQQKKVQGKSNQLKEVTPPSVPEAKEEADSGLYPHCQGLLHCQQITPEYAPYAAELEKLLASNKKFVDPKNPKSKKGTFKSASEFMGVVPELFQTSPQDLNKDRQSMTLDKFIDPADINQGSTGDCYFMSAMASLVGKYPQMISDLFIFEANEANYYVVQLFLDGEWILIKTDDRFPVEGNRPVFAKPKGNQLWTILLEKSYAKLYGSYQALDGGYTAQALLVLTGAPYTFLQMEGSDPEQMKKQLKEYDQWGYVMTTSSNSQTNEDGQEEANSVGLVTRHAYSILGIYEIAGQTVVKMRNPWGKFEWIGPYSFNDKVWTPELREQYDPEGSENDGIFFIGWNYFSTVFGQIEVCKLDPTYINSTFKIHLNRRKSGIYQFTVSKAGNYHIFICQQALRKYAGKDYNYSPARLVLMKANEEQGNTYIDSCFSLSYQICSVQAELQEGTYIVSTKVNWENNWKEHDCFLNIYGVDQVDIQEVGHEYAQQFKEEMVNSYSIVFDGQGETIQTYEKYGMPDAILEVNFSQQDRGIGYIKVTNNSEKKTIQTTINFEFTGMKLIKPSTNPHTFIVGPNEYEAVGFFVLDPDYSFSFNEKVKIK